MLPRDVLLTFLGLTEMYAIFAAYGTLGQHYNEYVCLQLLAVHGQYVYLDIYFGRSFFWGGG